MLTLFFQDGAETTGQELEPVVEEKTLSVIELIMNGGLGAQVIGAAVFLAVEYLF